MKEIIIREEQAGQRFDKFLRRYLPGAGSGFLYKMLRRKNIVLNSKKATGRELLAAGDTVRIYFSEDTLEKFRKSAEDSGKREISAMNPEWVLYEDDHLIALNKPAGVLSQGNDSADVSVADYLKSYLPAGDGLFSPGPANRLDRNTSGIILAGKDNASARELSELIRGRNLKKFYLALVLGEIDRPARVGGTLVKDHATNTVRVTGKSLKNVPGGVRIETAYRPIRTEKLGYTVSLLEVELITGRPHQIRAHLSSLGHPLIGDPRYGDEKVNRFFRKQFGLSRQFLHAARIEFPQMDGILREDSGLVIRSELPADLARILH